MIYAKVIADSISPKGSRVTTVEANIHRYMLPELNTHRVFSRNSASSRAIPFDKQVRMVMENPAIPIEFPAEQRGMQGGPALAGAQRVGATNVWLAARDAAVEHARLLAKLGVHKSVVNRLLEPFIWHRVIITATDWAGFIEQRCSDLAQPEIRVAAEHIRDALDESNPTPLEFGEWHLPYIDDADMDLISSRLYSNHGTIGDAKRVSAARCARVSYLTHTGQRDIAADLDLFQRLVSAVPMHGSPLEHVCTPSPWDSEPGNLRGWVQFRHELERLTHG
jgi:hypothetical protein